LRRTFDLSSARQEGDGPTGAGQFQSDVGFPTMTVALDDRLRPTSRLTRVLRRPELGALAGTILVIIIFAVAASGTGLFTPRGVINVLQISAELGILATAVALLMIGGEFDLSIGSTIGFAGVVIGMGVTVYHVPLIASVGIAFAFAVVIGYVNGLLLIRTRLPSFIVTLAFLFILRGLTLALTRSITGRTQIPYIIQDYQGDWFVSFFAGTTFHGLFRWFAGIGLIGVRPDGSPEVQGLPVSVLWWLGLTALATWVLLNTRFGNWIFAVGGDANAARNVGVPVGRVKIVLFILTALAGTLFATIQVLSVGSADTLRGTQKEFEAIIAAVIGGCLLTGGYGSAIGAAFGALIFGLVQMGIFYTGIDTDWFKVFLGSMVLIAVLFNNFVRRKATEAK
jgi:simple sugar transport system permease protein